MNVRAWDGNDPVQVAQRVLQEMENPLPVPVPGLLDYFGLELLRAGPGALPENCRALLDTRSHVVALQRGLLPAAERYAVSHEGIHYALPWHRQALYRCSEFDLSWRARQQMEVEANRGAAVLRFGSVSPEWFADAPIAMESVGALADLTESSFEASFRWFVEHSRHPLWGVICEPRPDPVDEVNAMLVDPSLWSGSRTMLGVRYMVLSPSASRCPRPGQIRYELPSDRESFDLAGELSDAWCPPGMNRFRKLGARRVEWKSDSFRTYALLS